MLWKTGSSGDLKTIMKGPPYYCGRVHVQGMGFSVFTHEFAKVTYCRIEDKDRKIPIHADSRLVASHSVIMHVSIVRPEVAFTPTPVFAVQFGI